MNNMTQQEIQKTRKLVTEGPKKIQESSPTFKSIKFDNQQSAKMILASNVSIKRSYHNSVNISDVKKSRVMRWIVDEANDLTPHLDRNHVLIHGDPQIIASRIDESLKQRSVQATFDSDNVKVTCTTSCFLKYIVTLYKPSSQPNGNDYSNSTIVEVQRRKGDSLAFRNEYKAIINAARGNVDLSSDKNQKQRPRLSIPPGLMAACPPPNNEELMNTLNERVAYFHTGCIDRQLMALRQLECMIDPDSSGLQTSFQIANMIMDSDVGVRDILGLILFSSNQDEKSIMMRHSSLKILSHALASISRNCDDDTKNVNNCVEEEDGSNGIDHWLVDSLFPSLVENVRDRKCLHNAFLSSRCLRLLLKRSSSVFAKAGADSALMEVLDNAVTLGEENHAKLEKEVRLTMNALTCY